MTFKGWTYPGMITSSGEVQKRLVTEYSGARTDFDVIVIGSGMGGGILADALADRAARSGKRILVLEAGSYLLPTHVFNIGKVENANLARGFECRTFWQANENEGGEFYIHARPHINLGGRSIFWSGLIPRIQPWEAAFFPETVRGDLNGKYLDSAATVLNASVTLGEAARTMVGSFSGTGLPADFLITEMPRALHQPYLKQNGEPQENFSTEPTGVFNTAELLLNQVRVAENAADGNRAGLHLLLNHFVEDIRLLADGRIELYVRNVLDDSVRLFSGGKVVLAGGSIESPKLLRRASLFSALPDRVKALVGKGLTDHPTTATFHACANKLGNLSLDGEAHGKLLFYSRGKQENGKGIKYPFNIEVNVNPRYWHVRDNDPTAAPPPPRAGKENNIEIKFSFGNCLDDGNEIFAAPPFGYVPEIRFHSLRHTRRLVEDRFPKLAGWNRSDREIFDLLHDLANQIAGQFTLDGTPVKAALDKGAQFFGTGTVHHAVGTLRMPYVPAFGEAVSEDSVVDENLRVRGVDNLHVCDMSVMPFSSAANPVLTLAALALRLADHLSPQQDGGPG